MDDEVKKELQYLVSKTISDRYKRICQLAGIDPVSKAAEQRIGYGIKKGTISSWATKGTVPRAETIYAVAKGFGVSSDYLLGLSDEMNDEMNYETKTAATKNTVAAEDIRREKERAVYAIFSLYEQLDETDRVKAEAFIQGLLAQDKYLKRKLAL